MLLRTLILLCGALLILAGCRAVLPVVGIVGSGQPATQTFDFRGFDKIEVSDAFAAEITAGDGYVVEVTVDDNLVDRLRVEQQGDTVKIGLEPFTAVTNAHMRARVTLPALAGLGASGASNIDVTGFRGDDGMQINASGASKIRGDMETGDLSAALSGGSVLELAGKGSDLRVTASGASTADLREFAAGDADITASGASRVEANVSGTLNASASGASTVHYTGDPTLGRVDESGASSVSGR